MIPNSLLSKLARNKNAFRLAKYLTKHATVNLGSRTVKVPLDFRCSFRSLIWTKNWKSSLLESLIPLKEGAFVDVGVNIGQTLFDFLSLGYDRHYFGFEPNPACTSFLKSVIDQNNLQKVSIIPVGLSGETSIYQFNQFAGVDFDASATILGTKHGNKKTTTSFVPCFRFDQAWRLIPGGKISTIKIDVEGAEHLVISGMREKMESERPIILCEVLHRGHHTDPLDYENRLISIEGQLSALSYVILNVRKDSGTLRCEEGGFPRKRWSKKNAEECDYIFAHESDLSLLDGVCKIERRSSFKSTQVV